MSVLRYSNFKLRDRVLAGVEPEWLKRHSRRVYIVQVLRATPNWANMAEMRRLDKLARERTRRALHGQRFVLDHIIPLNNPRVCGLNVHFNLQVIRHEANAQKSNHWCEWHGELFPDPEQFTLAFCGQT